MTDYYNTASQQDKTLMGMNTEDLVTPQEGQLTYAQRGVLWLNKEPFYIVDLIKEGGVSFVVVYDVQEGTKKNPQKAYHIESGVDRVFGKGTKLGQLATKFITAQQVKRMVIKDPIFTAPVLPNQQDTFTGKKESGFFEREADRLTTIEGKRTLVRGNNSGVYIGLSSIVWEDRVTVPTASILKSLIRSKNQDSFYDLEGQDDSSSNPLGSNYRGG